MTQTGDSGVADTAPGPGYMPPAAAPARPGRHPLRGVWLRVVAIALVLTAVLAVLTLSGKPFRLPVWAVAEVEHRLNDALRTALAETSVSVGSIEVTLTRWVPRLRMGDLRLLQPGGESLLTLPDSVLELDPVAVLGGHFRPTALRVSGARVAVRRDADGRFDLSFGSGNTRIDSLPALFAAADRAFALPALSKLRLVEAEALSLTLSDARIGRTWDVGDGRFRLDNRDTELAAELGMTLVAGGVTPAQALLTAVLVKGEARARVVATVTDVAASDLAAQTALLEWLKVLDAPISGRIAVDLDAGGIAALDGRLDLGAGALQPQPNTLPIAFDHVGLGLVYVPEAGRIQLTDLRVESRSLRLSAQGHSYLVDAAGGVITGPLAGRRPAAFLGQLAISEVMVDPEGLFAAPVRFSAGALDLRLRLDPFVLDIGQFTLAEGAARLGLTGRVSAEDGGWRTALDITINKIRLDRLLALWPVSMVAGTRTWVGRNIEAAGLSNVTAALRVAPGQETRLHLGYGFEGAELTFLAAMPPITDGRGYATIAGKTYTLVMNSGRVTPPQGGSIDVAGSVFAVPDITAKPSRGELTLLTESSLTAALSLLDQPPFRFLTKAGRPVDLGQGRARFQTRLSMPLRGKIELRDINYTVTGAISDFASDQVVPGKQVTASRLSLLATPQGMRVSGPGLIGQLPFDVTLTQGFGPEAQGRAQVDGTVELSQKAVEEFQLGLPDGMVSGTGSAQVSLALARGQPGRLRLVSDLARVTLALPELGWTKPAGARGRLEAEVRLGAEPRVDSLSLGGAGLDLQGTVSFRPGGGLGVARFDPVSLDGWLDAAVEITGQGRGRPVGLSLTGGMVDLRRMPPRLGRGGGGGGVGASDFDVVLDRLQVADGIALTRFRGDFDLRGGFGGQFTGRVNDAAAVSGTVIPARGGSAVRLQSDDAGRVLKAAGAFASAAGGALDIQFTPRDAPGHYDGRALITDIRVQNASVLAELLSAVSVVGLLEQLQGAGILFNEADAEFILTPDALQVTRAAAVGASLGVSMAGVYTTESKRLNMQGVISPIYLVNGLGAVLTRKGEGLFGFNYRLGGTADLPQISVNPLSILTPGMFRDIFRQPAPVLRGQGG